MNALVIGADGSIGSRLVAALLEAGHTVIGTSRRPGAAHRFDMLTPSVIPPVDVVYLCAAVLRKAIDRPEPQEWAVNVDKTLSVIESASRVGAFTVFLSSTAVETRNDLYASMKAHVEAILWRRARVAVVRLDDVRKDMQGAIDTLIRVGHLRISGLTRWEA